MSEEKTPDTAKDEAVKEAPATAESAEAKPAAKPKKEKAPALEDKPFATFIQDDFVPALKAGLAEQGITSATVGFEQGVIAVNGFSQYPPCSQVVCRWSDGYKQPRQFNLYFFDDDINGKKGFSYSESDRKASTLESFRIDERKSDLGLLVFWTLQRLNAQKWLVRN